MREPVFADTVQVALVVRDLDASMKTYVERYGIGPWEIYEFNPDTVENMKAHGEPVASSWRLALARVGGVMWELIEPLDDRSTYAEFLAEHGEGVHHVAMAGPPSPPRSPSSTRRDARRCSAGATAGWTSPTCRPRRTWAWRPRSSARCRPARSRMRATPEVRSTVETVRGPVALDAARSDAHARARRPPFTRGARQLRPRVGRALLGRGGRRRRRIAKLRRLREGGLRDARRRDRDRSGAATCAGSPGSTSTWTSTSSSRPASIRSSSCRRSSPTAAPTTRSSSYSCASCARGSTTPGSRPRSSNAASRGTGSPGDIPRILSCVAAASIETDSPVMVHTNAAHQTGRLALDFLLDAGVDAAPDRDRAHGRQQRPRLPGARSPTAAHGSGIDRFGIEHFNPEPTASGRSPRWPPRVTPGSIHLGHDAGAPSTTSWSGNPIFDGAVADWLHIPTTILPALLEAGVTQAQIDEMLLENPRRFFA